MDSIRGDRLLRRAKTALTGSVAVARRLSTDDLLRHGGFLAGATVLSGGINYAFQVFMGRALGPETYGVFGALFGLFYLANVLNEGIQFSATRFTAEGAASDGDLAGLHGGLVVRAAVFGVAVGGCLVLATPVVRRFLDLSSGLPVVLVAATIPLGFAFKANMGSIQGMQWFGLLGSYNVLYAAVKLVGGVALVLLGLEIVGAFTALVVAAVVALVATTIHVRSRLPESGFPVRTPEFDFGSVYGFLSPAILAGFCLSVPANVDVILVRHLFAGPQAGLYAAAAVLGKVLVFLPMGISRALFPKVTAGRLGDEAGETQALLDRALVYVAVLAGSCSVVLWIAPATVLEVFFGSDYVAAAPLVRWYGLAILWFVLALVVLNFELARDRRRFVYVFAAVTVAEVVAMWVLGDSMLDIVRIILLTNAGLFAYGLFTTKR